MGVKLVSASGGSVEINPPATASNFVATMPAGTGTVSVNGVSSNIVSGTSQASTSGTSIDFTGIPSWVKRITVMFSGVSTNGTSNLLCQIGPGSFTTSGYVSYGAQCGGVGNSTNGTTSTAGMVVIRNNAADTYNGSVVFTNISGNIWVSSHSLGGIWAGTLNAGYVGGGNISLSGTLDRVRITTVNGTDTFDAGSINILYE